MIYAQCVREAMSKQSGIPMKESNILQEKLDYFKFVNKKIDEFDFGNYHCTEKEIKPKSAGLLELVKSEE